jgi:colanic acid/amylovoran biosynthesis protein
MDSFLQTLRSSNLLILAGGGYLTDAFPEHAQRVLETALLAIQWRIPVAMFGQGLGPMETPGLRRRFRRVLQGTLLVGMREKRSGLPLLESLGGIGDRALCTGDDALVDAVAHAAIDRSMSRGLGVNLRLSSYSQVDDSTVADVRDVVRRMRDQYQARPVPAPVSRFQNESDARSIRQLLTGIDDASDGGESIDTIDKLVAQVGQCRALITGSYHAAVFALAQGVPVIGIARSAYYAGKFLGLNDLFGDGCQAVTSDQPDFRGRLQRAVDAAWRDADRLRPGLIASALQQIAMGDTAYERLAKTFNHTEAGHPLGSAEDDADARPSVATVAVDRPGAS